MANSQRGTELETEAARQYHCIEWTRIIGIPDLCGPHKGCQRVVAIYTKYLQSGIKNYNKNNPHLQPSSIWLYYQFRHVSSGYEPRCRYLSIHTAAVFN
jgi:hypothetical protein